MIRSLATIFNEALIVFLYVFLVYTYIGNVDEKFKGDGKGYYDYLPSMFAITAFIYYIRSFFLYEKGKDIIVDALLLGLILILNRSI